MRCERSLFSKVVEALQTGTFLMKAGDKLADYLLKYTMVPTLMRLFCRKVWKRTEPRKIVFCNFKGKGFGCNPKYVALELLRRRKDLEIVWLCKRSEEVAAQFPPGIKVASYKGFGALRHLATAKVWVDNQRKNYFLRRGLAKKEGQVYVQTFHAAIGIKTCGADMWLPGMKELPSIAFSKRDAEMVDYLISNSDYETNMYKTSFFGKGRIVLFGHPRNDVFFAGADYARTVREKVCAALGTDPKLKLALYAPTYRESQRRECYNVDYRAFCQALSDRFGGEWKCLVRFHPTTAQSGLISLQPDCTINVTAYADIQELLVASDAMLTDYSSCIFDFMLSGKPGFVYAVDLEEQKRERGFYYPLETTPFPIAFDNEGLCRNVRAFDADRYGVEVKAFLQSKGCMEDGHASGRVADLIEREMGLSERSNA